MKLGEATGAYTQMLEGCGMDVEKFNEGLAACKTEQEKQAYMLRITEQCLGAAGKAYKENNAEIIRANQANDQLQQSLAGIGGAIEPIITDIKLLGASLLSDAVPHVEKLATAFRGLMNGDAGASGDFAAALGGLVTGLVEKITQALPKVAQVGFSIIKTLGTSLLQQAPMLLSMAGQMVSQMVQGITTYLPIVVSKGAEMLGKLGEGIKSAMPGMISKGLDIISGLVTSLYNAAPRLIDAGFGFIKNLVQGLMNSLPSLIAKAPEIISKFVNILNHNVPRILKHGMDIIIMLVKGIVAAIPSLIQNAGKIVQMIVDVWQAINWVNLGKQAFTMLKNGLTAMGGALKSAGQKAGQWITNALKSLPGKLLQLGKTALSNMRTGITSMAGAIRAAGGNILTVIVNALRSMPSKLLSLGKQAITFLGNAIKSGIGTIKAKATNIVTSVVGVLKTLPSKVLSIGKNMVQGIWEGISGATTWIKNKIKSWVGNVTDFLKNLFGINSPSTVMRDEIGRWLPAGIAEGVDRNAKAATNSMAALSRDMVAAVETDVGGLNFERGLSLSRRPGGVFGGSYAQTPTADNTALLAKLDAIYERLNRLQVVLDTGATVGGIVDKMDAALAAKQALHARGV